MTRAFKERVMREVVVSTSKYHYEFIEWKNVIYRTPHDNERVVKIIKV